MVTGGCYASSASAEDFTLNYSAALEAAGTTDGNFVPHYMLANRHGTLTSANSGLLQLKAWRPMDASKRFNYSFGVEAWSGIASSVDYNQYVAATDGSAARWTTNSVKPPSVWLQQLYGELKYRSLFLTAGMKEHHSALLNQRLSSGDVVESGNARPIPEVRAGFLDFQNIPFTNGWVQIQGEIGYGKTTENNWLESTYSYYYYHINLDGWYNYKRCFFRTNPAQPLSITVGMQAAAQFAGVTRWYIQGECTKVDDKSFTPQDLIDMVILKSGEDYWKGNHVGSWDFNARYRLPSGHQVKAYFQWLWEDGSGIGKLNGWDGLWGLEWKSANESAPVRGAVLEFMTYMNQSGPMHYDYDDMKGTTLVGSRGEGMDNYYNNTWYNGYAHHGMGIGSPMFMSPMYNVDGYTTAYADNRFWGVHAGVDGTIIPGAWTYRVLASYRRFYGTIGVPRINTVHDVSAMVECNWNLHRVPGLQIGAQLAFDTGNSDYGDAFAAGVKLSYSGLFNFTKKNSTPCVENLE